MVLISSVSFRASESVLNIINDVLGKPLSSVPSWLSVRTWFLRLGYYKLYREKVISTDWCWIADHTIQLGQTKCLLILGIRLSELPTNRNLQYKDLEPIELFPVEKSSGEIVFEQLEKTAAKTGIPRVIVSDYGSDLKLGISKFCDKHPECGSIYDIKHKTASLLKKSLGKSEDWEVFTKQVSTTKNKLQQTALSHLSPPNQRSKARYMNMEIVLNWSMNTLKLLENKDTFSEAEQAQLVKLDWLKNYTDKLYKWNELLSVANLAEECVRREGITKSIHKVLEKSFGEKMPLLKDSESIELKNTLIGFLESESVLCNGSERLLGSSEIIESVFGKQKYLEREYCKEGFTSLILGIGSFIGATDVETIKDALIFTPVKKVVNWCKEKLGETLQSKKKSAYSEVKNGTKAGSICVCKN